MIVAGVDGYRGGWVIARFELSSGRISLDTGATFRRVLDVTDDCVAVGVDMPIALPVTGLRASDQEIKTFLGRNGRSLFWTPTRDALAQDTHAAAVAVNKAAGGKGPSAQGWGLAAKIREVRTTLDALRITSGSSATQVFETHPESGFTVMAGEPLPSKRSATGVGQRLELLTAWLPNVATALSQCPPGPALDDALDAMAAAWSARRVAQDRARWFGPNVCDDEGFSLGVGI